MKFDHIIMNPPYCKNLHLKILSNALDYSDDIVNLSPIRWLQDPLAEFKKNSDWIRFKNIRERIESIKILDKDKASNLFGTSFTMNIGIYHITNNTTDYSNKFKNPLISKMVLHIKDTVHNHIIIDDLSGISLLVSLIVPGCNIKIARENGWIYSRERSFYTNRHNESTGKTYWEYSNKHQCHSTIARAQVSKPKSENTNLKFNSKEERLNFYNSWSTKCLKYLYGMQLTDMHVQTKFLPYLGDYTHPWTDNQIYKYFDLTEEEIKEIENTIK